MIFPLASPHIFSSDLLLPAYACAPDFNREAAFRCTYLNKIQQGEFWQRGNLDDILPATAEVFQGPLIDGAIRSAAGDEVVVLTPCQAAHLAAVTPARSTS